MPLSNPLIVGGALLGLCALMIVLLKPHDSKTARQQTVNTRGHKPRGAVYIPLTLGNVTVDLQPTAQDTIHAAISGTTGTGKSTSVLRLFDLDIGVLCVALDNTRPISAKIRSLPDGIEWTNEPDWGLGLDILSGKPRIASEVLVEGWAAKTAGDTGKWRDIAAGRLWTAIERQDYLGIPRSVPELAAALLERTGNSEADRACQDWAGRLASLSRWLGPALGPDLDLVQAMRDRKKVLLRLNRFANPRLAPMLGGMLLVHARRVAEEAGVPFVLIVEEAGQMGLYEHQLSALAQAGRDRGVPLVLLTQNASLLPIEVQNNVSVWCSFAQEAKRELAFAAERMRLEPEQLQREAFKDQGRGWCYVRAPGVQTTLVHIKQQRPLKTAPSPVLVGPSDGPSVVGRWELVEQPMVDGWRPRSPTLSNGIADYSDNIPEWVGADRDWLRIWAGLKRTGLPCPLWLPDRDVWWDERGCLEQQRGFNKDGRPRCSIQQRDGLTYRETYRAKFGQYPDPSFDHWCDNVRCADPDHGGPCGIGDNNARRMPRRAAFAVAWAQRERVGERRRVTAEAAAD